MGRVVRVAQLVLVGIHAHGAVILNVICRVFTLRNVVVVSGFSLVLLVLCTLVVLHVGVFWSGCCTTIVISVVRIIGVVVVVVVVVSGCCSSTLCFLIVVLVFLLMCSAISTAITSPS